MQTLLYRAFPWIVAAASGATVLALTSGIVSAHDAPSGWAYHVECCSGFDCREVGDAYTPDAAIRVFETDEGFVISSTGEVIPYGHRKVRNSPDGRFHWCSVAGKPDGKTICLYAPPRGF